MSVTGPSYNINAIKKLSELELEQRGSGSWHDNYKSSCYIFIGGLPFGLTEGDIVIVFSQLGEIIDVHLVRDKKTGASKGFAFVGFEDQRSTVLAVDNFNDFQAPRKQDAQIQNEYKPTGSEGQGIKCFGVTKSMQVLMQAPETSKRPESLTHEELLVKDADEEWARRFDTAMRREKKRERRAKRKSSMQNGVNKQHKSRKNP